MHPPPVRTFDCAGATTDGECYPTIASMWESELLPADSEQQQQVQGWYEKSASYWQTQSASINGMLGGLGNLDKRDAAASRAFLLSLRDAQYVETGACALDVGAGIGRVTGRLLLPLFREVDLLEQNEQYLQRSESFLAKRQSIAGNGVVVNRIACGMQQFSADWRDGVLLGRFDLIWIQWCIIYLTDDDLVSFLRECQKCLRKNGLICIKDNVAREGFLVDKEDSSVMRSDEYLKSQFVKAGLTVLRETEQVDFPKEIFPVRTYALKPIGDVERTSRESDQTVYQRTVT